MSRCGRRRPQRRRACVTVLGLALVTSSTTNALRPTSSPLCSTYDVYSKKRLRRHDTFPRYIANPAQAALQRRIASDYERDKDYRATHSGALPATASRTVPEGDHIDDGNDSSEGREGGEAKDANAASPTTGFFLNSGYSPFESDEEMRRSLRRRSRRRSQAKIEALPVVPEATRNPVVASIEDIKHSLVMGARRIRCTAFELAWGRPVRFVRGRALACKLFLATRRPIHWASFWMATYIATTAVVPKLESR